MGNIILNICSLLLCLGPEISLGQWISYTEERTYRKLQNTNAQHDFPTWARFCTELGDGWQAAVINSETEYKYIREHVGRSGNNQRPFFIAGSTFGTGPGYSIEYYEYMTTDEGSRVVYIETGACQAFYPFWFYLLKSGEKDLRRQAILCKTDGLSFHSNTSMYQKLVSATPENMTYWTDRCFEIGFGWIPVILNSEEELDFIMENQRGLSNNLSYWIAGSTRYRGEIDYFHYLQYTIGPGIRPVYVSTEDNGTFDNELFQLTAGSHSLLLYGVLCENDGSLFQSETSQYRKLASNREFDYPNWALRCKELGMRWAPAFIDDYTELEFIQRQEQISADNRGYFIGGISYEALESYSEAEELGSGWEEPQEYSEDTHAWLLARESDASPDDVSTLVVELKSFRTHAMLCEAAIA